MKQCALRAKRGSAPRRVQRRASRCSTIGLKTCPRPTQPTTISPLRCPSRWRAGASVTRTPARRAGLPATACWPVEGCPPRAVPNQRGAPTAKRARPVRRRASWTDGPSFQPGRPPRHPHSRRFATGTRSAPRSSTAEATAAASSTQRAVKTTMRCLVARSVASCARWPPRTTAGRARSTTTVRWRASATAPPTAQSAVTRPRVTTAATTGWAPRAQGWGTAETSARAPTTTTAPAQRGITTDSDVRLRPTAAHRRPHSHVQRGPNACPQASPASSSQHTTTEPATAEPTAAAVEPTAAEPGSSSTPDTIGVLTAVSSSGTTTRATDATAFGPATATLPRLAEPTGVELATVAPGISGTDRASGTSSGTDSDPIMPVWAIGIVALLGLAIVGCCVLACCQAQRRSSEKRTRKPAADITTNPAFTITGGVTMGQRETPTDLRGTDRTTDKAGHATGGLLDNVSAPGTVVYDVTSQTPMNR